MKDDPFASSTTKSLCLNPNEISEILSKTLIAKLATVDPTGSIHIVPMWFIHEDEFILIPTSQKTHKFRNLQARPYASVMIDISLEGLDLRGVLIRGKVELIREKEAHLINHKIHLKYIDPEAFKDPAVLNYLSAGDDISLKIHIDNLVSWNLADSMAGMAIRKGKWSRALDMK
jgi:Pyridoxamine 5'-phosphate oxidase